MTKSSDVLLLNEDREDGNDLAIFYLDGKMLHADRGNFVLLLMEVAEFYINSSTNSTALHAVSCSKFGNSC